jgi:hypothetical protein
MTTKFDMEEQASYSPVNTDIESEGQMNNSKANPCQSSQAAVEEQIENVFGGRRGGPCASHATAHRPPLQTQIFPQKRCQGCGVFSSSVEGYRGFDCRDILELCELCIDSDQCPLHGVCRRRHTDSYNS